MRWIGLAAAWVGVVAASADGGTHVLTIGGGPPSHNQVSLERNVQYFQRVLASLGLGEIRHDIYFGDGGAGKSVQYRLEATDDVRFDRALGMILTGDADADIRYSQVQIPSLVGPSNVTNVDAWFETVGRSLSGSQDLLIYFTGHGGPDSSDRERPRNTTLIMPGRPGSLSVKSFIEQLDKVAPDVDVTLVMVQCYSGGFANVIYNEGDPEKGFARQPRAGFFATIPTRTSAGCTPDIDEDDYHEFSTSFFEALAGESRTGRKIERPDYDGDGRTAYDEAFTYVLLTSQTVDIPNTTSDRLLRDKSRFASSDDHPNLGLLPQDAPWSTVLAAASPARRAALEGLAQILELDGEDLLAAARDRAKEIDPNRNRRNRRQGRPDAPAGREDDGRQGSEPAPEGEPMHHDETAHDGQADGEYHGFVASQAPPPEARRPRQTPPPNPAQAGAGRLRNFLKDRWPELTVPLHPDAPRILAENRAEIRQALESQGDFKAIFERTARRRPASGDSPERRWVKHQRLLETADSVILGANLPKLGDAEALGVYRRLLDLESRSLTPPPPAVTREAPQAAGS